MNKFKKIVLGIKLLVEKPSLINLIVGSDYYWHQLLSKKYPKKTQLSTINIEELIPDFNENLTTYSFLGGGSIPTDIMLLKALCKQIANCSYFEIGTWRGESVINVAEVAKECYTLNLSNEEIIALGLPQKYADLHGFYSKGKNNIKHLLGDSMFYDFKKLNKKFDVIFIDGNHSYTYVKNDTEKVFKHLLKENTVVIWHDYAYNPEEIRPEVLLGILDGVPEKEKTNLYHVSNTLCAIYIGRKLKNSVLDFPLKPTKKFVINASIKNL
ncbi:MULTISPECIES: class I SAM-dependent methyltransferase [unclassified Polaribacter]|uniref:class I SAM-dependent methyltransferase n=1 Tax=unclassified Polaribacter TaxID=196858 RepID=UPI0011BE6E73|nr:MULTISPECIES: class I SAM-dependent methyltransferase [unclassified Polaribacter]TXD54285.1 class I SAM-dependent methyltransferase [Polaribacter sp. IC063]TXD62884.1 class I SAM-dependent methyltransferase [Polaribacter sp. IC066]